MNTANTILQQIKTLDPRALFAWGAKDLVNTGKGLQFRTGGMAKHKGLVHVKYNEATDLYDIDFIKIKKSMPVVVHAVSDVFVEDLVNTIDLTVQ